jgi:hypothetical protein
MPAQELRIAVVSSPRSGNSWIRSTLAGCLNAADLAFHTVEEAPATLPPRCLVQIHANRTDQFQGWIDRHGLQVLTIARHPLDILLSAVRYSYGAPDVRHWLSGATGLPADIPSSGSEKFLNYCISEGAARLLSITPEWWQYPPATKLRYENAVADPIATFTQLLLGFGGTDESLATFLRKLSITNMQKTPNRHGWRGDPGHWAGLVASRDAEAIHRAHAKVFDVLGYGVPPYVLSRMVADQNWRAIA